MTVLTVLVTEFAVLATVSWTVAAVVCTVLTTLFVVSSVVCTVSVTACGGAGAAGGVASGAAAAALDTEGVAVTTGTGVPVGGGEVFPPAVTVAGAGAGETAADSVGSATVTASTGAA